MRQVYDQEDTEISFFPGSLAAAIEDLEALFAIY